MEPTPLNLNARISPEVADHLGFYVYLYVDPRDEKVFFVGKGQGSCVMAHLFADGKGTRLGASRSSVPPAWSHGSRS